MLYTITALPFLLSLGQNLNDKLEIFGNLLHSSPSGLCWECSPDDGVLCHSRGGRRMYHVLSSMCLVMTNLPPHNV